jgi:hypothetical protein
MPYRQYASDYVEIFTSVSVFSERTQGFAVPVGDVKSRTHAKGRWPEMAAAGA